MIVSKNKIVEVPDLSFVRIQENNIYRALGMTEYDSDEHLSLLIDQYSDISRKLCTPCLSYSMFDSPRINILKGELYVDDTTFAIGKELAAFLLKSTQLIFFTVTCGDGIERLSKKLMKEGHLLEGLIVDIIGSEVAEELAEYIAAYIEKELALLNLNVSNRYSPGYCNWPVSDQQNLFRLMDNNHCGIELTSSSLMLPIKSVSGIIGAGKDVKKMAYKCQICKDVNCVMRRDKIS
jgi:hypothetical protein